MEGNYCEARAKKRRTGKDTAIMALIYIGIALSIVLVVIISQWALLLTIGLGILAYFMAPMLNVEYEYVFCDGQIDIDKILNDAKRKHVKRVDMEQMEFCAPSNSHSLDGYNRPGIKVEDYSSLEADAKTWTMVMTAGGQVTLVRFEPNEEMLRKMKQKSPRKIVEY